MLTLLCACAGVLALRSSVLAPYHVPTASMAPNIKPGDRVMVEKFAYGLRLPFTSLELWKTGAVQRGDVVLFSAPHEPERDLLKRVIAVGGDAVRMSGDRVLVNGVELARKEETERGVLSDFDDEGKAHKQLFLEHLGEKTYWTLNLSGEGGVEEQWVVPVGSVFVLGDNRDLSQDSRRFGAIPLSSVEGRAAFVLWSYGESLRWERIFLTL